MVEAQNFVEKELGQNIDIEKLELSMPAYTPPPTHVSGFTTPAINQEPTIKVIEKVVYKKQRIH